MMRRRTWLEQLTKALVPAPPELTCGAWLANRPICYVFAGPSQSPPSSALPRRTENTQFILNARFGG